jgi:MOSC domain-containing protein YiiM
MEGSVPRVVSVNVGAVRTVEWQGRTVVTAIWKEPVEGRITVRGVNLDGDDQADRRVHGGPDKAVYAYSAEDYVWWSAELGRDLAPGTFGDNLTVEGLDLRDAVVGSRWRVGSAVLEVAQPRWPCFKLGIRMGDASFVDEFGDAGRFGAYLRIVTAGDVGTGDAIDVTAAPAGGVTVSEVGWAVQRPDPDTTARVVADAHVPERAKELAAGALRRAGGQAGA